MTSFGAFLLVGGFSACVNVLCGALFGLLMPFELAVTFAFPVALLTAFFLTRAFVFKPLDSAATFSQIVRFTLVNLLALIVVWAVSVGLLRFVFPWIGFSWHAETIAHAIGVASPVLSSYVLHRNYTFRA